MSSTQKPEALVFADDRPTSIEDGLYQWAVDAEGLIRAQQAHIAKLEAQLAATQPAAQEMDSIRALIAQHSKELEHNHYAYFELAYTRSTGWMVWITDKPAFRESVLVNPDRKVLASGQGDTPEAACDAALAAQAKQGGAANG